jgi:hypothetical protein
MYLAEARTGDGCQQELKELQKENYNQDAISDKGFILRSE